MSLEWKAVKLKTVEVVDLLLEPEAGEMKKHTFSFKMETQFSVSPEELAHDILNMSGVNYELGPLLRMSAPDSWKSKSIVEWPTNQYLFSSNISFLGLIPIDRHFFNLKAVDGFGFSENSKSLMNSYWSHERLVNSVSSGSVLKDVVIYESRLGILGILFMPVYKAVFKHRHNRLIAKYSR